MINANDLKVKGELFLSQQSIETLTPEQAWVMMYTPIELKMLGACGEQSLVVVTQDDLPYYLKPLWTQPNVAYLAKRVEALGYHFTLFDEPTFRNPLSLTIFWN